MRFVVALIFLAASFFFNLNILRIISEDWVERVEANLNLNEDANLIIGWSLLLMGSFIKFIFNI